MKSVKIKKACFFVNSEGFPYSDLYFIFQAPLNLNNSNVMYDIFEEEKIFKFHDFSIRLKMGSVRYYSLLANSLEHRMAPDFDIGF